MQLTTTSVLALFFSIGLLFSSDSESKLKNLEARKSVLEQELMQIQAEINVLNQRQTTMSYDDAKVLMKRYKTTVATEIIDGVSICKKDCVIQGYNMSSDVTDAIQSAKFSENYLANGEFHGARVYYGLTEDDEKVAVVTPLKESGQSMAMRGSDPTFVVGLKGNFTDPCPNYCD